MPVRRAAAIRIISTAIGVVTFCVLLDMLSLPGSRVRRDDEDVYTVYSILRAPGQAHRSQECVIPYTRTTSRCA